MAPNWRTSSYTKSDSCVEVADNDPNEIRVRDTKAHDGGVMSVHRSTWTTFVEYTKCS
ncbi:DUF397 domain-containing protein [Streptomyces sp. NPDC086549]|uniref:DUF397 domain-containing protein n=1 Tax=Streptomyces sp. NPDC086549 TaxID=3365752 RepID=UPI0037F2DD7E